MKTENLTKAFDSFGFFLGELRDAHTDAVNSGDQFAEIVLLQMLEDAVKMNRRLDAIKSAVYTAKMNHTPKEI